MKHTALPWQLHPVYPGLKIVANYQETEGSATYSEVCNINPDTDLETGTARGNVDLILTACNSHDELVELLNHYLERRNDSGFDNRWQDFDSLVQQALAKATRKEV